jgi:hypothetical protein
MPNGKDDLKNQLQSIKDSLDEKLSKLEKTAKKIPSDKIKNSRDNGKLKKMPISINVDMEVVEPVKEKKKKQKVKKENKVIKEAIVSKKTINSQKSKPASKKKKNNSKSKKRGILIPSLLILALIGSLLYVLFLKNNLKAKEQSFEKSKEEAIDYREDVYFKEVEDEVDDEEMQDFAVYKDVPELVAQKNTKSEVLSASDEKDINRQILQNQIYKNRNTDSNKENTLVTLKQNNNSNPTIILENTELKKENTKQINNQVYSDLIKVVGLQHKDGSFSLPKKAKKTNAFKVRVRLKKDQLSDNEDDIEIMLVIKDDTGKTIKIDSKNMNFKNQNSKVLYLEFYEVFPERLKTNVNYSFSIFANKKLVKTYKKSI